MQKYFDSIQTKSGNAVFGASVTVYDAGTTNLATIYSDEGVTAATNPLTTSSLGYFEFYAANGKYDIKITGTNITTQTITDVELLDADMDGTRYLLPSGADDTAQIQAAIDAMTAIGGGDVILRAGTYSISSTLTMTDASGVRLIGAGGGWWEAGTGVYTDIPATLINWTGGASPVFVIASSAAAANPATSGGVSGIGISCGSVATKGIYCTSIYAYEFNDISIRNATTYGMHFDCLDDDLASGAGINSSCQGNNLRNISIRAIAGDCMFLDGNLGDSATSAANFSLNYLENIQCWINGAANGVVFGFSDGNELNHLRVFRAGGATGTGLIFKKDSANDNRHARHNICYNVQTSSAGVTAEGTGGSSTASADNAIIGFNTGNAGSSNYPTIETGATLSCISEVLIKNLGGQLVAVYGATDTAAHTNAAAAIANLGTESLRVENSSSNHVRLYNSVGEWGVAVDATTGDLKVTRITGTGVLQTAFDVELSSALPRLVWEETDAAADNKRWHLKANGAVLTLQALTDADSGGGQTITVQRTGNQIDSMTLADSVDIIFGTGAGSNIGTATTQKLGFWAATPITQPTALTTALTQITHTAPGTPDYAFADTVDSGVGSAWGFSSHDEANTVLSVILNLQTRVDELESKLQSVGLIA